MIQKLEDFTTFANTTHSLSNYVQNKKPQTTGEFLVSDSKRKKTPMQVEQWWPKRIDPSAISNTDRKELSTVDPKSSGKVSNELSKQEFMRCVRETFRDTLKTSGQLKHILAQKRASRS